MARATPRPARSGTLARSPRALARALVVGAASALAVLPLASRADQVQSAEEIQAQLAREKTSTAQLAAKESSLLGRLADLERQVELESRSLRAAQTRLRLAQARLSGAEDKVAQAQAEVDAATRALGPRLTARYRLGREGYVRFLLGARSIGDLLRRKRLYSALLEGDLDALHALRFKVLGAAAAKDELQAARDELARSASAEQERRSDLLLKAAVQKKALASVQQEKGLHEQAARELEQAARALSERLRAIDEAKRAGKPIPAARAPDANDLHPNDWHPNDSAAAAAASAPGSRATAPSAAGSAAEPPGKKLAMVSPPIRSQRGKLLFPVESGRVEVRFGRTVDPRFGTVTLQRGLDIRAPEGSEVHAVYAGTVVHAGWFSGYGNLVILDHGDGLFSLFAHLGTLAHGVGDAVAKGDSLGTVGDTGSLKGAYLYFELRDGQKPLDPERWLSRAQRKHSDRSD
jgi:septal ring factor EnvC (AmiA/AmiB activator)